MLSRFRFGHEEALEENAINEKILIFSPSEFLFASANLSSTGAAKVMKIAGMIFLSICSSLSPASANIVGILNVHTAPGEHGTTGWDSGQPVAVQIDFSKTQDGMYDITVWSGERQFAKVTRVDVQAGKAAQQGERYRTGPTTVYCPAIDLKQNGPTSFQVFIQAVLDENGQKGGRVLIAEVAWQLGSVADNQPGKKVEPRPVVCSAGSNLDSHATGSFLFKNQSNRSLRATLMFGGRKYGEYNLSAHGNQRIQADAWGVNPGVGWYVTSPNPLAQNGKQIEAAGPIFSTEGGTESGFNAVEFEGPNPSPTPTADPSASSVDKP
jgi:hypothetical protein